MSNDLDWDAIYTEFSGRRVDPAPLSPLSSVTGRAALPSVPRTATTCINCLRDAGRSPPSRRAKRRLGAHLRHLRQKGARVCHATRAWLEGHVTLVVLLLLALAVGGCGHVVRSLRTGAVGACRTASAGYRAINSADKAEQDAVRAMLPADPDGAERRLDRWITKRGPILILLDETESQCGLAAATADAIEAGKPSPEGAPPDVSNWITRLLSLVPRVVAALADLGIRLPLPAAGGVK